MAGGHIRILTTSDLMYEHSLLSYRPSKAWCSPGDMACTSDIVRSLDEMQWQCVDAVSKPCMQAVYHGFGGKWQATDEDIFTARLSQYQMSIDGSEHLPLHAPACRLPCPSK